MIWLTWRQFRMPALVIFAAVAALGIVMAVTGPHLLDLYNADKVNFLDRIGVDGINKFLYVAGQALVYAAPPVIGAFWGAPLIARELEAGTHRLVWNQSITRHRWLATKLGLTGLAAMAVTGLLSLAVSWWSSPIDRAVANGTQSGLFNLPRIVPAIFGARGVVPIGYAAFAFALGVAVGLVVRRSVVAIAVTLAAVAAVQIVMPLTLRSHLVAPVQTDVTITATNIRDFSIQGPPGDVGRPDPTTAQVGRIGVQAGGPGDWMLSNRTINAAGQIMRVLPHWVIECGPPLPGAAKETPQSSQACFTRLADEGYRQRVAYQPASHFWALQWRETGILLALALLLTGFCFWRIRRDLS
jgi:ABC-type transport system involved in multi-copper enzyme maturation permease subunit